VVSPGCGCYCSGVVGRLAVADAYFFTVPEGAISDQKKQLSHTRRQLGRLLDRATRSVADLCHLLDPSDRQGWDFVALDLGIDASTPMGRVMASRDRTSLKTLAFGGLAQR
jgi:hypothetical protein